MLKSPSRALILTIRDPTYVVVDGLGYADGMQRLLFLECSGKSCVVDLENVRGFEENIMYLKSASLDK